MRVSSRFSLSAWATWLVLLISPCMAFFTPAATAATTYWVSSNGAASWSSCAGTTPLSGAAACSLATANANAAAGDVVYLRAGTYNTAIAPSNSGTGVPPSGPWSFITFQAYTGETPVIATSGTPNMDLTGRAFIRVNGLTFTYDNTNGYVALISRGANHNEVENCTFNSTNGWDMEFTVGTLATSSGGPWATNNWIHNNVFNTSGRAHGTEGTGCTDGGGDVMKVGHAYSPSYPYMADNNNTVENNVYNNGPHATMEGYGLYTVIRNNITHNEPWSAGCPGGTYPATYSSGQVVNGFQEPNYASYNGSYGHRDFEFDGDFNQTATYYLIEGNRIGFGGMNQDNAGADGLSLAAPQNIVRYNDFYASMNPGLRLKGNYNGGNGAFGHGGTDNRIYNNTFYDNGYGYPAGVTCSTSSCPLGQSSIGTENTSNNVLKNNLFYLSYSYAARGWDIDSEGGPANGWSTVSAGDATGGWNWCSGAQTGGDTDMNGYHGCRAGKMQGNPAFANPDLSNPFSTTLPDLSLQAGSGAIDGATSLTTATNAGSASTTLTVADALYFQDGTWGADIARSAAGLGGTFQPDWIAIGTVTNVVQIKSIAYGTASAPAGTITLASPATWGNGAPVWLYRKSDGALVLSGSAPDYGASESTGVRPPSPDLTGVIH